ncbi:uncharacterized protein LOC135493548 [Lineus longissimus]|uniref:uncharacterized protein LOC135493548 n=1 Tax=Lineus longissimus TaxID=88925 RepID=UPI00315CB9F2
MAAAEAKKERGIAKGGKTRADKTLYGLIGRKRPLVVVEAAYQKALEAYQELVGRHKAYLRTLDAVDIETEDAWLEAHSDKCDQWGYDVNDYAATFITPAVSPPVAVPPPAPIPGTARKLDFKVDRVDKPAFSGKVLDYFQFRKDFKFVYTKSAEEEALYCLRKAVSDEVRKWLVAVDSLSEAWTVLDQQYGDPRIISDAVLNTLAKDKPVPEEDSTKFANFYHEIRNAKNILGEMHRANDLDNSTTLATIISKLCYSDKLKWARFQLEKTVDPNVDNFLQFMNIEMKIKRIAGAEIRSGAVGNHSSSQKSGKVCAETAKLRNEAATSHPTVSFAKPRASPSMAAFASNRESPKSCWFCAGQHCPQECDKFHQLSLPQRLAEVRKNKCCYFCLNKHYSPCRQRKKCTQLTGSNPCKYSHHVLLHGAPFDSPTPNATPTASMTGIEGALTNSTSAEDKSLLPVIQADILNMGNGLKKSYGCIFLDSGASLSLIKEATAKQFELPGENVTVTIGKIGASEEEFRTKLYTLHVRQVGGCQSYRVKAIGIPEICGEIAEVKVSEITRHFDVEPNRLHRGSGYPDLLIGLDFVKFHVGETTVNGEIALRETPLGPVVFGVAEAISTNKKTGVYCMQEVRRIPEVNLEVFWTTEEMGIAVNACCMGTRPDKPRMTPDERAEDEMIPKSAIKVGERWMIPIPWKWDPHELPDNYTQALARLQSTEKKLRQNDDYAQMYQGQIDDLVARGCARKLTTEEIETYHGPVYYLSHHAVLRPEKESTPCRVVFNSAANFRGHCLNEYQCKGPNLLNSLLGVIMRFRERPIAIYGDISKMYHSILISPTVDANTHRFLWRNLENRPPDTYKKLVLTSGDNVHRQLQTPPSTSPLRKPLPITLKLLK